MRKILTSICAICAISTASATEDLLELYELNKASEATLEEYSRYCETELYKLNFRTEILTTRLSGRNTFFWYLWNDANKSNSNIEKFRIVKDISKITTKPEKK